MEVRGTTFCNLCHLLIGLQRHVSFEYDGRTVHFHDRFSGDCYGQFLRKLAKKAESVQLKTVGSWGDYEAT